MAKLIAEFTFRISMEVKDGNDHYEIARTGRRGIQDLLDSDGIRDNITKIIPIREDSVVDEVSNDVS